MKTLLRNFVEGNFYLILKPHFISNMLLSKKSSNNLLDKNHNFSMRHESMRGIFVLQFLKPPHFTPHDPFQNVLVIFQITSICIQIFLLLLKGLSNDFGFPSNTWYLLKGIYISSFHHQGQNNCHKLAQAEKSLSKKKGGGGARRERKEEIRVKRINEAVPNTLQAGTSFWDHE